MLVYDLEILRAIPGGAPLDGIEYCDGWHDHQGMGISVVCAYDYQEDRYRVFDADNRWELLALIKHRDVFIGFNNINFDNRVLQACWDINVPEDKCYDILRELWAAAGLGPDYQSHTHSGFGLDAVCEANFGLKKSGRGDLAPVWWQTGKIARVVDYCLNDVLLTKRLADKILRMNDLADPRDKSRFLCVNSIPDRSSTEVTDSPIPRPPTTTLQKGQL